MATEPHILTTKQKLADVLLGDRGPLDEFVHLRRSNGSSWRMIALDLRTVTNNEVDVTGETLRAWFGDEPEAAS